MNYIPTLDSFMTAFSSLSLLRMLCSGSRFSEIFALGKCDRYNAFRMFAGRGGGGGRVILPHQITRMTVMSVHFFLLLRAA